VEKEGSERRGTNNENRYFVPVISRCSGDDMTVLVSKRREKIE
jgi:hypothetical protein